MPIRVEMLGDARVELDGETVHPLKGTIRDHALALLALTGEWVTRDRLGFLFWADSPDSAARHNVRQLLKRIRRLQWMEGLETTGSAVRWTVATDVADLGRAVEQQAWAMLPTGGELLPGLERNATIEFEEWLLDQRRHVQAVWRSAITSAARDAETRGDPGSGMRLLEPLLATHDGAEILPIYMELATQAGERGLAISAFERVSARLQDDLGLDPPEKAQRIAERLAAGVEGPRRDPPPGNVIGRSAELAEIIGLLSRSECRLMTLFGPGGIGKSTMAEMVLDDMRARYVDGGALVSLESIQSPDEVSSAIASDLSMSLDPGADSVGQLVTGLRNRRMLLVLDNVEHLGSAWTVFSRIVDECPGIDLVVTSRERLRLEKEWVYELAGLSDDDGGALFLTKGRRVAPDLTVSVDDARAVSEIVGGSPLGIELAVPWLRVMPPAEIIAEIERNIEVLSGGYQDGPVRHRSVAATMERSWDLASERQRRAIEALSVFAAPYTRQQAEEVAGATATLLRDLMDQSLVHRRPDGRYASHPLVRAYAAARLGEDPERRREVRDRHARTILSSVAAANESDDQAAIDDLIVAWEHAAESGAVDLVAAAVDGATALMVAGGRIARGLELLGAASRMAEQSTDPALLARMRHAESGLLYLQGDHDRAVAAAEQALRAASEAEDRRLQARSFLALGWARKWIEGDHAQYESTMRALPLAEELGDRDLIAEVLNGLGCSASTLDDCRLHLERGLAVLEPSSTELRARLLYNLGMVSWGLGDADAATNHVGEALAVWQALEDRNRTVEILSSLAFIHADRGDLATAQRLVDEAEAMTGASEFPKTRIYARLVAGEVRRLLGDADGARSRAHEALAMASAVGNEPYALRALRLHGQLLIDDGATDAGLAFLAFLVTHTARKGGDFTNEILDPRAWKTATTDLAPERLAAAERWAGARRLAEVVAAALESST